ncbi:MAG: SOS response-associated peptidase [Deltaproteobacteria bacterium]|nr:SOS response-associated peptidase [Deltaproteobacteria bacterium]
MCGRFTLTSSGRRLQQRFALAAAPADPPPRYNIAPSQPVLVIPNRPTRRLRPARWGLIPHFADDPRVGHRHINARAETLATRPAFRAAFARQRCLIPSDGFYEWRRGARAREPFHIRPRDGEPLAFAGLWDVWRPASGEPIASCTIITTGANPLLAPIHDRMPVILPPDAWDTWLDPAACDPFALRPLLVPCPDDWLEAYPVSSLVNAPAHEDPACIAPLPAGEAEAVGNTD